MRENDKRHSASGSGTMGKSAGVSVTATSLRPRNTFFHGFRHSLGNTDAVKPAKQRIQPVRWRQLAVIADAAVSSLLSTRSK
jgi:hypothetical protein